MSTVQVWMTGEDDENWSKREEENLKYSSQKDDVEDDCLKKMEREEEKSDSEREAFCGCEDPLWSEWTPTVYRFPHGTSLLRGCFWIWICIDAPWTAFLVVLKHLHSFVLRDSYPPSLFQWIIYYIFFLPTLLFFSAIGCMTLLLGLFAVTLSFLF